VLRIIALDPSLVATGVCDSQAPAKPYTLEPPDGLVRMARLRWIQKKVQEVTTGAHLVVVEAYAHAAKHQAHYLGELGGVIRLTLYCLKRPYVDVAPTVRAKMATGKGNAKKDEVFAAAFKRLDYSGHSKDEADARWLLECALQHYKLPGKTDLPRAHTEPSEKSRPQWPTLRELGLL
jgi:crossover junction endodeoxyribonuclease RuvC